jgi:hypothetical protein
MFVRVSFLALAVLIAASASLALAQQPPARPYDGIQAGLDAFKLAEERRQSGASQQLFLNDQLKFWSGLPTSRGETIYYGYASPVLYPYGYGPLIYSPSAIYGYGYATPLYTTVRQPIGQWQGQTGPNRWESHPVYDPPLTDYRPLPPVDSPLLDRTPYAAPPEAPTPPVAAQAPPQPATPPPAPRRTPREY